MYEFGSIVLVPFPFTDLSSSKLRPALIISQKQNKSDLILAFISSQKKIFDNCIHLDEKDKVFVETGLKQSSAIRLDKIATLDKKVILGKLGQLPKDFLRRYQKHFYNIFGF